MPLLAYRRLLACALAILACALALSLAVFARVGAIGLLNTTPPDPVTAAWNKARTAGSYHFQSDVIQMTVPTAKVTNVGRTSQTQTFHVEGQTDILQRKLEMQLWSDGGSVLQTDGGLGVKVEHGKTFVRQGAKGEWQENADFTEAMAPQGDFMAYLQAVRNIQAHAPEKRAGIPLTRYSFTIDGPSFATFVRDQTEAAMRAKGELPNGITLEVPQYYYDMTGDGELWVGESGLPLRQILNLTFPEQKDATLHAQITVDFLQFGQPQPVVTGVQAFFNGLNNWLPNLTGPLILLPMVAFAVLVVRFHRARRLEQVLSMVVIVSLVLSPLLSTLKLSSFLDAQIAKAAAQDEQHQASTMPQSLRDLGDKPAFNPQVNPLAKTGTQSLETNLPAPMANLSLAPAALLTDNGVDSDGDGLSDFVEERVGTDATQADSDADGLNDALEVRGFTLGGQTWYANPRDLDSNDDGIDDGQEWDSNNNSQPDDTDGDGLPDLFDPDNDNDGVPDRLDLAAYGKGAATFSEVNPLQLTLTNLTPQTPTLVDFQLRPTDINHLWYAYNVLDWPLNDDQGQIQDIDNKTFADLATAQGRTPDKTEGYGDLKLVPMLEIRITGATTNLPPQSDLEPYNISVNRLTEDGSQKVVYVPLSLVTDEQTSERVAFSARMRYLPDTTWPSPHDIRLAWVVQALVDVPTTKCAPGAQPPITTNCTDDGYIHNSPQVIQTYYDDFTLSGLNVSEQHGTKTAIVYEDPAVDPNRKDDAALVTLSVGLDQSFLAARDQDNNNVRDVDIKEIARRFDHQTNGGVSPTERWGMEGDLNILRVERHDYATFDQASIFTAMTDTVKVLNTQFNSAWTADNTIKPTLLFAYEQQSRALSLDALQGPAGYVTLSGNGVTFNMQPGAQPQAGLNTMVGMQWQHYCRDGAWAVCDAEVYWEDLNNRYATSSVLPEDSGDADIVAGRLFFNHVYDLALTQGIHRSAQIDNRLLSSRYSLDTDTERERDVRLAANGGAALYTIAVDYTLMKAWEFKQKALQVAGKAFKEAKKGVVLRLVDFAIESLSGFKANKMRGTGVALTGIVVVGGLAASAYFGFGEGKKEGKIALKAMIITIQLAFSVAEPVTAAMAWSAQLKAGNTTNIWHAKTELVGTSRTATAIGTVVAISIVWGFFIYSMVSNKISAFGPEFNRALAETIAATLYIIFLTLLSLTVAGLILVGIVTVIDTILTAVCELGEDDLRDVPGMGGACFTLGTAATKAIAYLFYNYDVMIDTSRDDLVSTGAPKTQLADPSKGFVVGNDFTITMPITTHVAHKNPDPSAGLMINFYLYLYSKDNLRSTTFNYTLTQPQPQTVGADRGTMKGAWHNVGEDHKYVRTPMYGGYANSAPSIRGLNLQPGLNQTASFYLNMGYALPAYECWAIPIFGIYPVPVCYTRDFDGHNSTKIETLHYDIFPNTVGGFMALGPKISRVDSAGAGLSWDAAFPALHDADGDGLISKAFGGTDPNDQNWNSDSDNLPDTFELERRALGIPYSLNDCDTDGDGLTDGQEAVIGSNPAIRDTDNDGLDDNLEVWHQVYNPSTCQPTNAWSGGWDVRINATQPFTIRVNSDPTQADADKDGISDLAEKQLAQHADPTKRVDKQNRPYHPNIFNVSPITVLTAVDDADRYVALNQNLVYTTTVIGEVALAPSLLDISAPGELGGARLPALLTFDAANTAINQTNFTVQGGSNGQSLQLTSNVRARLTATGPAVRTWDTLAPQTLLPTSTQTNRFTVAAPRLPSQQDSFLFARMNSSLATRGGTGDVRTNIIPTGQANTLVTSGPAMGDNPPDIACNNFGTCMVVWDQVASGDRVMYAVIRPDGSVTCCQNVGSFANSFHPAVATDGTNFVIAYGHSETSVGVSLSGIVTQKYNRDGALQATSNGFWSITGAPLTNSQIALDMVWSSGYYMVAYKFIGVNNPRQIRTGLIDTDADFTNVSSLDSIIADPTAAGAPVLGYNPATGQTILLYQGQDGEARRILYYGLEPFGHTGIDNAVAYDPITNLPITGGKLNVTVDPRTNEWLITVNGQVMVFDPYLNGQQMPAQAIALGNQVTLACPARSSVPVADLRFEEFPGATSFGGASCSGNSCPAAGLPGATDAQGNAVGGGPLGAASDYAVQFDGIDDQLTMGNPLSDEFSIAFWYKANTGGGTAFYLESGQPNGMGFFHYNNIGVTEFYAGGTRLSANTTLSNGQWHFVVVTRASTGALALYIDGNTTPVATAPSSPTPTMTGEIRIGGGSTNVGLDNLLLYKVALSSDAVQALYNRTTQSFCVGAWNNQWAKVNATTPDTRGGKITASGGLALKVDTDLPIATVGALSNGQPLLGDTVHTIGGNASDDTSGVARVEVSINGGPWEAASGSASWAYNLSVTEGNYVIRVRAIDNVGNVGNPSAPLTVVADKVAPTVSLTGLTAAPRKPTLNANGQWVTTLGGTAADDRAGLTGDAVEVHLQGQGAAVGNGWQKATLTGQTWALNYTLPTGLADPTGTYTVSVRAADKVDNQTADQAATGILHLDVTGPAATLSTLDATRQIISDTLAISGVLTDTGAAGVNKLEVAFVSVEQIAALPADISAAEADALLNRTWLAATVAQPGASTSAWTLSIPAGLEGEYQIDLRGTDTLGNVLRSDNIWRGVIDTLAPRLVVTGTRGANSWFDYNSGLQMYDLAFTCTATDRYLNEATFTCPAGGATPVRTFDTNPVLQALFPDRTIRNGLTVSAAYWWPDPNLTITVAACDVYGHCATHGSGLPPAARVAASSALAATPGAPKALVVAPTKGSFVAGSNALSVTVAAEAGALLKQVTISMDNRVVATLDFAQTAAVTRTLRTVNVTGISEGQHTVTARATDWANATQSADYPVTFTLDTQPPALTIDPATLTNADTWQLGSGILRFNGTAHDSIGLAAVQIREGNNPFVDVEFSDTAGGGVWQTALPVQNPEGRTLNMVVRAIDRAGRIREVTQTIGTNLSSATPPETTLLSNPANPSPANSASFVFTGTASVGSPEVTAFACQLDGGDFIPCTSPQAYSDLSKGPHTFQVRAIDAQGNVDLTPASFSWTVNASALDATITNGPANPSNSRAASFTFTGTGTAFDCALDTAAFTPCASPQSYNGLAYGDHHFQVRARDGAGQTGAAASFAWTVLNAAPVANNQTVTTTENLAVVITLNASDADPLTYQVGSPAHGVLFGIPPNLTYSPDSGYSGTDSFTFVARDSQATSNVATVTINIQARDSNAPVSTITLAPATPGGQNGWYSTPVHVTVAATDGGTPQGVAETRCLLDPATPPLTFGVIASGCLYIGAGADVTTDGVHTVYAASRDTLGNLEIPVSKSFQIDRTPPLVNVTGVSNGATYLLEAVPAVACNTTDATSGVATPAALQVSGGNAHGAGVFTATCQPATDKAGNSSLPVTAIYTVTYNLAKFVVLAQEGVAFGQTGSIASGDIGARIASNGPFLADNAEVSIGQGVTMQNTASRLLGDTLVIKQGAIVYNPGFNTWTNQGNARGKPVTPLNLKLLPSLPALPAITPGTQAINVAQNGTLTLNPGSYGALMLAQNATLTFKGGLYQFQSWSVGQNAKIYFQAATEIRVVGRVSTDQNTIIGPATTATTLTAKDIVLYVAGKNGTNGTLTETPKAVAFGQNSTLKLNVLAPNGTIQLDQNSNLTGALLARWVNLGQAAKLTLAGRFATNGVNAANVITDLSDENAPLLADTPVITTTAEISSAVMPTNILLPLVVLDTALAAEETLVEQATTPSPANVLVIDSLGVTNTSSITMTPPVTTTVVVSPTADAPSSAPDSALQTPMRIFLPLINQ